MSTHEGTIGQGVVFEPTSDHPMGLTRFEVLGMPLAMFIDIEGRSYVQPGSEITITVEETS